MRLLIYDLHDSNSDEVSGFSTDRGFATEWVGDGGEFAASLRGFRPDIVVADWDAPGGGGDGALVLLEDETPDLPLVVTGVDPSEFATFSKTRGYGDRVKFLRRPFDLHELYDAVWNSLSSSEAVAEA